MRFNSVRTSDYSQSAKAVNKATDQIFDAAMSGKPDFTKISQEAIKGRSLERRTATEAEGAVAKAGLDAIRKTKLTRMKADTEKEVSDIKRPAKRMAGIVAGLGAISQAAVTNKNLKDDKLERQKLRALEQQNFDAKMDLLRGEQASSKAMIEKIKAGMNNTYTAPKVNTSSSTSDSSSSTSVPTVSTDISAQHSFDPSKKMTKEQIKQVAQSVGFSPEAAGIVVGIAGGESGFDPTNSTRRSGLYDKTGEDSVGLMQINWGYHKDSGWLQKLGITKREDLFDPVKNMTAAKYLYDGRKGNFGDWTVYNKGIYKDYL